MAALSVAFHGDFMCFCVCHLLSDCSLEAEGSGVWQPCHCCLFTAVWDDSPACFLKVRMWAPRSFIKHYDLLATLCGLTLDVRRVKWTPHQTWTVTKASGGRNGRTGGWCSEPGLCSQLRDEIHDSQRIPAHLCPYKHMIITFKLLTIGRY